MKENTSVAADQSKWLYLALSHGVEMHPLWIKDEIGWNSAAFIDGDVTIFESSSAACISFDVFHYNLFEKWKKK